MDMDVVWGRCGSGGVGASGGVRMGVRTWVVLRLVGKGEGGRGIWGRGRGRGIWGRAVRVRRVRARVVGGVGWWWLIGSLCVDGSGGEWVACWVWLGRS